MNADPAAQQRLLRVADIDAELGRIDHRRRTLPELAALGEAERRARTGRDAVTAAETRAGDLDRELRRLERDVDAVRARGDRDRDLLTRSGTTAKQTVDLQHELDTLARRQGVLEDELLEIMEQREAVDTDLERAKVELTEAEAALGTATTRRDDAVADLDSAERGRSRERAELIDGLPDELMALYERQRARGGAGAAPLRDRRCGACRLELDRTALAEVQSAPPEAVVRHEECGAILVRGTG
jgi:predicted  nucleic acid-binding Zn-ribbon protein